MSGLRYANATVGYGVAAIVADVALSVAPGELVGLIGPNGAGKSTLLRAVTGVADLIAGSLEIDGAPVARLDARQRARLVGVVPQTFAAPFAFSSRAYVEMGRHAHLGRLEAPGETDAHIVAEVMEVTDTARLADDPVDTLSGGDLQRLTLAQALAQQPRVLLLDEPTSHLDLNHRLQVLDLVRDLADSGMAVLGAFHDLDLAARYSDRLAVVADGAMALTGAPEEVLTPETLREVFAVRAVVGTDAVTGSVSVTPVLREATSVPADGPRVFVVGGSGAGAPIMRRLVLAGFRVSAGALNRGDVDAAVADALGIEFVELPPFGEIDPPAEDRAAHLAAAADVRLVCDVPFGRSNLGNLRAVERAGTPTVLVGEMTPERDFAGGEAAAIWERIVGSGGTCVQDVDAALAAVERLARS